MKKEPAQDFINAHLEDVTERMPTTVEVARGLLEGGAKEKIDVTLRRAIEPKIRAESPARGHLFSCVEAYIRYLETNGHDEMVVLADPRSGNMAAVLDEGQHNGYEVIHFTPSLHPLWEPWQRRLDLAEPWTLKELAAFIIGHRNVIVRPAAEEVVAAFKQIQISKQITIYDGTGATAMQGFTCMTKLQHKDATQCVQLPERLVVGAAMFVDGAMLEIEVDVLFETEGEAALATLVSSDADLKRVLAIKDMLKRVTDKLPNAVVGMGTLNYDNWKYIN